MNDSAAFLLIAVAVGGLLVGVLVTVVTGLLRARGADPAGESWQRYQLDQRRLLEGQQPPPTQAELDAEAARRKLRELLNDPNSISIVYQPIIDMRDGRVVGVEALARMQGELERSPGPWFAAASASGMLRELELATIAATLRSLPQIPAGLYVSINVSPGTVETTFGAGGILMAEDLDLARVVVEITERELIEDYSDLLAALVAPRQRGVRIGIDDLGTGFAGLGHVLGLQPDLIKLDISLTSGIDRDPVRRALASSIVQFTSTVGSALIAEGVETEAQRDALLEIGCRYGQGFLFAVPRPLPEGAQVTPPSN